jgi:hypothetical protein
MPESAVQKAQAQAQVSTSVLSAQDQDRSRKMASFAVKILDSSSLSSRPGPLQEDGLIRHEDCQDDLEATKEVCAGVLDFIANPRDLDIRNSSHRNGLTHRRGESGRPVIIAEYLDDLAASSRRILTTWQEPGMNISSSLANCLCALDPRIADLELSRLAGNLGKVL